MKKKLIRVTTADISLYGLLKGQLGYLNQYFDVVGLASDSGQLSRVSEREGVRTINVKMAREISIWQDIKSLISLIRLFNREKPFIVHANTPKGSLLSMIAAWLTRVPHRIYTVTGLRFETAHGIFRFILKSMERVTCLCANTVIPEGEGVKSTLLRENITHKQLNKILNGNINGIDTEYFSPDSVIETKYEIRKKLKILDDETIFIFIGRIVKDKGMIELANSIERLSSDSLRFKLILVGWFEDNLDPLPTDVSDFLKNSDVVTFVGRQEDVRPYLKAADALVFPSHREGFPNVVLEAGAMGLPAIVTDINGCNEIIINENNGIIIPKLDGSALYGAMKKWITKPAEMKQQAANARKMIKSRYERADVWKALVDMYKTLE